MYKFKLQTPKDVEAVKWNGVSFPDDAPQWVREINFGYTRHDGAHILYTNGYEAIGPDDYVVRDYNGNMSRLTEEEFVAKYQAV